MRFTMNTQARRRKVSGFLMKRCGMESVNLHDAEYKIRYGRLRDGQPFAPLMIPRVSRGGQC